MKKERNEKGRKPGEGGKKGMGKILVTGSTVLLLSMILLSMTTTSELASLQIFPHVPQEDDPMVVTLQLRNPHPYESLYRYELYKDGMLLTSGATKIGPYASRAVPYGYLSDLELGERVVFQAKVRTPEGEYREEVSLPAYPPQIWSSFVSFATFSTSMAGLTSVGVSSAMASSSSSSLTTMTTTAYYREHFSATDSLNVGVIFSLALIAVFVYIEATEPLVEASSRLSRLRRRFARLAGILLFIFASMVFSQAVFILS
jgi:hypothetical protein